MPQQKWRHQSSQNPKTRQGLRQEVQLREEENDPKNFLEGRTTKKTFDFLLLSVIRLGSSINDVTHFWIIFDTPSSHRHAI